LEQKTLNIFRQFFGENLKSRNICPRLGEFLPLVYFGKFFGNCKKCPHFGASFSTVKVIFLTKNGRVTFLAIFHKIILSPCSARRKNGRRFWQLNQVLA
jgi:hypothetical protein